jgi:hypothetical protein
LEALEKILKAISIPLGSSVGAFDGRSGLIRIYHGREGWIDFFYRNIEQPQWDPLLAFIHETTERFPPSPPAEMPGNFFDDPPQEDPQQRTHGRKSPPRRQPDHYNFGSLIVLAVIAVAFLLVVWVATKALFVFLQESPIP